MADRRRLNPLPRRAAVALLAASALAVPAGAQGIRATVDRTEATMDDQIVLTVTVEGSQSAQPSLPELPDFQVYPRGQSTQIQLVNGQMSASISHLFALVPSHPGTFTIGAATVSIDGQTFHSQPFTVRILAAGAEPQQPAASRDLFIDAEVSTREPYIGEEVVYTWRFYRRVQVANARLEPVDFPGFVSEKLGDVREYQTTVGGQRYAVSELRTALFPQEQGQHTLAGPRLACDVLVQSRGGGGSLFEDFFGRTRAETKSLRTPQVTITVRPLPAPPKGFSGLVGSFDVRARLSRGKLAVGDSATLELTVSGTGNAQMIGEPRLPDLSAFKVYDDKPSGSINRDGAALSGEKTFRKALVPLRAGTLTVPAVELTYFDPRAGSYRTASTAPLTVQATPAEGREELRLTASLAPTTGKVAVKILADDILPIYKGLDALAPGPFATAGNAALWSSALAAPPLLYLGLLLLRRRQERHRLDAGLRRRQDALRTGLKTLRRIDAEAGDGRPAAAAEMASQCLRRFVGDKLGLEGSALTAADADTALRGRGVDEAVARETHELLDRLDAARYAAPAGAGASSGDGSGGAGGGSASDGSGAGALSAMIEPLLRRLDRELRT
jgi:BatD DUF11 like domain